MRYLDSLDVLDIIVPTLIRDIISVIEKPDNIFVEFFNPWKYGYEER